ncbi:MAG TPA: hypothetical protein VF116_08420 [Ktedonobacterales bacterium]
MNLWRRVSIVAAAAICVVFSLIFAILVVAAKADRNPFDQLVLVGTGSALLGAGLVVVLVQVFTLLAAGPDSGLEINRTRRGDQVA